MSDTILHVVTALSGVLAGVIVALKVIAPMTATTKDDSVLERMEALEELVKPILESLGLDGEAAADPAEAAK